MGASQLLLLLVCFSVAVAALLMQHLIGFYTDASTLVWNGNVHKGTRAIAGFYCALPNSTHSLLSVDCQPLKGTSTCGFIIHLSFAGRLCRHVGWSICETDLVTKHG